VLAQRIISELESKEKPKLAHDSSTNNLIRYYRTKRYTFCVPSAFGAVFLIGILCAVLRIERSAYRYASVQPAHG
jgi:hypothetical protein